MNDPLNPSWPTAAPGVARTPMHRLLTPMLHRLLAPRLQALLAATQRGSLTVELPGGRRVHAAGKASGPDAVLHLQRWRALLRLITRGDLGLAEAYRDGDWRSPDLVALLRFGAANDGAWGPALQGSRLSRLRARLAHRRRDNSRRGSRDNIAFHYDLGNRFYAPWLDTQMLYSSALYEHADDTLEAAQARRLARIVELMAVPEGARVLEIGCGWGALALALARQGAHVTGLTLSTEQLAHAQHAAREQGLAEQLDLRLQDYRDVRGQFDRIVSIEMIEAVGEAWWPTYFRTLHDRLAPGGHVVLQAITIADAHFEHYRREADFIQRHIFPGGMLPSPSTLQRQAEAAGLLLQQELAFGASYARTLADWRRRFADAWPALRTLGFDERFRRLWEYYLCYCEAGFRSGRIDVGLYTLRQARQAV